MVRHEQIEGLRTVTDGELLYVSTLCLVKILHVQNAITHQCGRYVGLWQKAALEVLNDIRPNLVFQLILVERIRVNTGCTADI